MSPHWSRKKTREQYRAWYAVKVAIRRGVLIRPEICESCGRAPGKNRRGRSLIEAHHYAGYAKSDHLKVRFLCPPCHKRADAILEIPPAPDSPVAGMVGRLRDLKRRRELSTVDSSPAT